MRVYITKYWRSRGILTTSTELNSQNNQKFWLLEFGKEVFRDKKKAVENVEERRRKAIRAAKRSIERLQDYEITINNWEGD